MDKTERDPKTPNIVDLTDYRKNRTEARRREYERLVFNRLLGAYSYLEQPRLHGIEVIDVSFSGVKFRDDRPEKLLPIGEKLAIRFYFTPQTYLRLPVEIKRIIPLNEEGRSKFEYGCSVDSSTKAYEVLKQLINFMQAYAEVATEDSHPPMIWF